VDPVKKSTLCMRRIRAGLRRLDARDAMLEEMRFRQAWFPGLRYSAQSSWALIEQHAKLYGIKGNAGIGAKSI